MANVNLRRDWKEQLLKHAAVRGGAKVLGGAVAKDAQSRTAVRTGRARASVQVVERNGEVYVVGGVGAWWFSLQELGGQGFRPPPMPLRRAASKYGRIGQGR